MRECTVGTILEDGTRVKGFGNGGYEYFWDEEAFNKEEGVCYIDEKDNEYTFKDFLDLTRGDYVLATYYFGVVSGTSPELLLEEDLNEGEVEECPNCKRFYSPSSEEECPYCK